MNISPFHLAALAVAAVDGLNVAGTRPPYETTEDFITGGVLDTEGRSWVVQYPITDHGGTLLEAQTALSPSLLKQLREGHLSFDVMRPEGFATYKGRQGVVYPAPLGKPQDFEQLSTPQIRELGRTLGTIHMLTAETYTLVGLPAYSAQAVRDRLLAELDSIQESGHIPSVLYTRWIEILDDDDLWVFTPVPVHGDVAPENFLWSNGSVRTVLGFGQAHVGDPSLDLAAVAPTLSDEDFQNFIEAYKYSVRDHVDAGLLQRIRFMAEFAWARYLMHGILTEDRENIDDAKTMLDQLALDVSADSDASLAPQWHLESEYGDHDLSEDIEDSADDSAIDATHGAYGTYATDGADGGGAQSASAHFSVDPQSSDYAQPTAPTADYTLTADVAYSADSYGYAESDDSPDEINDSPDK